MSEINEKEVFLSSHKTLQDMVIVLSRPILIVKNMPPESLPSISEITKSSVIRANEGASIDTLTPSPSKEVVEKILLTFCESHLKLRNDEENA